MSASQILRQISPIDIYSSMIKKIPSPSREHIVPQKYLLNKKMSKDLNNLFVCNSLMNSERGILPYGIINDKCIYLDGRTGIRYNTKKSIQSKDIVMKTNKLFYPPEHARGPIARTCLYMMYQYPSIRSIILENVIQEDILYQWMEEYPIKNWEIIRSQNIYLYGFPKNTCIIK